MRIYEKRWIYIYRERERKIVNHRSVLLRTKYIVDNLMGIDTLREPSGRPLRALSREKKFDFYYSDVFSFSFLISKKKKRCERNLKLIKILNFPYVISCIRFHRSCIFQHNEGSEKKKKSIYTKMFSSFARSTRLHGRNGKIYRSRLSHYFFFLHLFYYALCLFYYNIAM